MNERRRPLALRISRAVMAVLAGAAIFTMALTCAHPTAEAWATTDHSAMVVVDNGSTVDKIVVHFSTDTISGKQALDLTGLTVVYQTYGSMGNAVCKIQTVGCNAGQNCLTCDPNGRYWAYSHADAGSDHLTTSSVGVDHSVVHDGDEEGWRWGTGQAPQYVPFGSPPPPSTTTTGAPPPTATSGDGTGPAASTTATPTAPGATTIGSGPATAAPTTTVAATPSEAPGATEASGSTLTVPAAGGDTATTGQQAAAPTAARRASSSGGSATPGLIGFAAILAALAGAGLLVRRRNRAATGP